MTDKQGEGFIAPLTKIYREKRKKKENQLSNVPVNSE
jgi:hypothetical protein